MVFILQNQGYSHVQRVSNRAILCWITEGRPSKWTLLNVPYYWEKQQRYEMGLCEFLVKTFSGQIYAEDWLPETFSLADLQFERF